MYWNTAPPMYYWDIDIPYAAKLIKPVKRKKKIVQAPEIEQQRGCCGRLCII